MQKVSAMRIIRMWRKRKLDAKIKLLTPKQKDLLSRYFHRLSRRIALSRQLRFKPSEHSEHSSFEEEYISISRADLIARRIAALKIFRALKFYTQQIQLAREYLEK